MKKVVRLTESDLVNIVKRVISEQTEPKKFKIGRDTHQINKVTKINDIWSKIEYVKVLPNGMTERALKYGFVLMSRPKFIYQNQNTNSQKIGPSDVELIVNPTPNPKPVNPTPNPQPVNPTPNPQPKKPLIEKIKDGLSNIYKGVEILQKDNKLDFVYDGNKISIELKNPELYIRLHGLKMINRQYLGEQEAVINLENEKTLDGLMSSVKTKIDNLIKKQLKTFKTTTPDTKISTSSEVPNQGTPLNLSKVKF